MQVDLSGLNWFDILIISFVSVSILFAFFKGFIRTFFSFMNWLGAGIITVYAYPYSLKFLQGHMADESAAKWVAYFGVFVLSFIVLMIINGRVVFALRSFRWGVMDRTFGFGFGLLRGTLLVCLVFYSLKVTASMLDISEEERVGPDWFVDAKTYNALNITTEFFLSYMPQGFEAYLEGTIEDIGRLSGNDNGATEDEKIDKAEATEDEVAMSDVFQVSLNKGQKKVLRRIILSLSEDVLKKAYGSTKRKNLTDTERHEIYRRIIRFYEYDKHSYGSSDAPVTEEQLQDLKKALGMQRKTIKNDEKGKDLGYKPGNVEQLNRLISNF